MFGRNILSQNSIRLCVLLLLLAPITLVHAWDTPAPQTPKDTVFYSGNVRAMVRYKDWLPMFESNYRLEGAAQGNPRPDGVAPNTTNAGTAAFVQQPWYAMIGSYYNIFDFLMIGGFYSYGEGGRHRNDWISSGWNSASTWDWFWLNTNNRVEQSAIADITLRKKIPFLPGDGWVFELKNRAIYTWYTDARYSNRDNWGASTANIAETQYVVRPGIQYFWLDGDRPFMTFFLQYEAHFALDFGTRTLVESWGYLGFLYNITEQVALGLNIARAEWWWSTSNSVQSIRPAEQCSTVVGGAETTQCNSITNVASQRAWVFGFTAMLRIDLTPDDSP